MEIIHAEFGVYRGPDQKFHIGVIDDDGEFSPATELELPSWRELVGLAAEILLEPELKETRHTLLGAEIAETSGWLVRRGSSRLKRHLNRFAELCTEVTEGHGTEFAPQFQALVPGITVTLKRNHRVLISDLRPLDEAELCNFAIAILGDIRTCFSAEEQYAPFLGEIAEKSLPFQRYSITTREPIPTGPTRELIRDEILAHFAESVLTQAEAVFKRYGL